MSDNHVSYGKQDEDFTPAADALPYPVLMRGQAGIRASQNGRCMSQCILTVETVATETTASMRSLSKSDPSLEDKNGTHSSLYTFYRLCHPELKGNDQPDAVEDDDEPPQMQAPAPPPVLLTRKNSVVAKNSWQTYFHSSGVTPHTVSLLFPF